MKELSWKSYRCVNLDQLEQPENDVVLDCNSKYTNKQEQDINTEKKKEKPVLRNSA